MQLDLDSVMFLMLSIVFINFAIVAGVLYEVLCEKYKKDENKGN